MDWRALVSDACGSRGAWTGRRAPGGRWRPARRRRGFTLLEVVLATGLTGLVAGGMVSAIVVVTRAGADDQGDAGWRRGAAGIERMQLELPYATGFRLRDGRAVEFTVADRTGDNAAETIRYSWSGVEGEGLVRTINGVSETIVSGIGDFSLEYLVRTQTESEPGPELESSERLLAAQGAALLGLGDRTFRVEQDRYIAQAISPALPSDATSWSITRVKVVARADELLLGSGTAYVQIRPMNGSQPGNSVLGQGTISESLLGLVFATQEVSFGNVTGFGPTESAALVLAYSSGDLDVSYTRSASGKFETQDGGATWQSNAGETLIFEAYGRYTSPGTPVVTERHFLSGVRVRVQTTEQDAGDAVTSVALLGRFEVPDATGQLAAAAGGDEQGAGGEEQAASMEESGDLMKASIAPTTQTGRKR